VKPVACVEVNVYVEAAQRVRALLQSRDKSEAEIAAILRKQLDVLGESDWLIWCETEFGWARSTAYRHLDPAQVEKERENSRERAATSRTTRREQKETKQEKHNARVAYLLRASGAVELAEFGYRARKITQEEVDAARKAAAAWTKLAEHLQEKLQ